MRSEVQAFVADGPLPDWDADEDEIDRRGKQLDAIPKPITAEEAQALARCFGPDDCYGVAWTLLHLIETGPGPVPVVQRPGSNADQWHHTLWNRWGTPEFPDDGSAIWRGAQPLGALAMPAGEAGDLFHEGPAGAHGVAASEPPNS